MTDEKKRRLSAITENTLLPLSLVFVLIGGIAWLTNLNAQTLENSRNIQELLRKQEEYNTTLARIDRRLSHIEGKMGVQTDGSH